MSAKVPFSIFRRIETMGLEAHKKISIGKIANYIGVPCCSQRQKSKQLSLIWYIWVLMIIIILKILTDIKWKESQLKNLSWHQNKHKKIKRISQRLSINHKHRRAMSKKIYFCLNNLSNLKKMIRRSHLEIAQILSRISLFLIGIAGQLKLVKAISRKKVI